MTKRRTRGASGGGTIRKRSDGRWEARYSLGFDPKTGKQVQKSIYGKTQGEVRKKLSAIVVQIDTGTYVEPSRVPLGSWLDTWLKDYTGNLKPATKSAYEEHIRVHLKPYLGNVMMSNLTTQMAQRLYNMLQQDKGLSPKSIKNIHGVFHKAIAQAIKLGYLRNNPLDAVILPRVEKRQIKAMEDSDMAAFLAAIKGHPYENILFVTVFTGLRQGEVLGLTWDCVSFENNTLLINKQHNKAKGEKEYKFSSLKNDRVRMLTVAEDVMDVLRRQKTQQDEWAEVLGDAFHNEDNLVFTNEYGRFVANQAVYRNYKKIMEKIGLGNMRFHDLRHTYAVNSLKAGDDIKTVQENLGHATAAFTLGTYAHATIGMKRESAKRMEQYIQSLRSSG
ncbi:MAG: site-specific integrase [Oscillospiraceae bacterium]|nr:site-specific integrase [Oscillospiraceae bacterium]